MIRPAALWLLISFCCSAQTNGTPDPVLVLARLKQQIGQHLADLSNYSCLQITERARSSKQGRQFRLLDTIKLDVAMIEGRESYSWRNATFQGSDIAGLVGSGMIGNGHFAQILRSIFTDPSPTITYAGPEQQDGRSIFRYQYRVPTFLSGYRLRNIQKEAIVGHHGLIWIDPDGYRLLKIHMDVDDIPPHFGFAAVSDDLFYGVMRGDQRLLAPLSAETIVSMESGRQDRLRTYFSHWRKYRGESQISFGSSPPVDPAFQRARDTKPIGAGIRIPLRLDTAIDIAKASVGDSITGTVLDSSRGGPPTGATVEGVIRTIDHIPGATVLGIQFLTISFDGKTIPLYANLIGIGPHPDLMFDTDRFSERLVLGAGKVETYTSESFVYPRVPGVGKFALRENVTRVSAGLRMVWLTE